MELTINHILTVSAILFTIGVVGIFVNRKNIIVILQLKHAVILLIWSWPHLEYLWISHSLIK